MILFFFDIQVCNHPDLFESRPTVSAFVMDTGINYRIPSELLFTEDRDPFDFIDLRTLNLCFADTELCLPAFASHRTHDLRCPKKLIEEIDNFDSDVNRSKDAKETTPSNIFDILNPDVSMSKSNVDNSNSCDGNEIDVVGDIDVEDSATFDTDPKEGRLLDDFVSTGSSVFSMVSSLNLVFV